MRFATLVVAAWLAAIGLAPTAASHPDHSCQEDQDCWNCAKMGNRICGTEQ